MRRTRVEVKADLMRQAVDGYHALQHLQRLRICSGAKARRRQHATQKLELHPLPSATSLTEARSYPAPFSRT